MKTICKVHSSTQVAASASFPYSTHTHRESFSPSRFIDESVLRCIFIIVHQKSIAL